jgi:hypothetical protein
MSAPKVNNGSSSASEQNYLQVLPEASRLISKSPYPGYWRNFSPRLINDGQAGFEGESTNEL